MKSTVTKFTVTAGSKPHTAQYGACVIFQTDTGERLYWDTSSKVIHNIIELEGKPLENPFHITYRVVESLSETSKTIAYVKIQN